MNNVTAKPGQQAMFKCQVDMSCIVAYIEWYHEMYNGTEKLIKVTLNQSFIYTLTQSITNHLRFICIHSKVIQACLKGVICTLSWKERKKEKKDFGLIIIMYLVCSVCGGFFWPCPKSINVSHCLSFFFLWEKKKAKQSAQLKQSLLLTT